MTLAPIATQEYFSSYLTCSYAGNSSEACLSLLSIPFCINTQTGKFHNADLTTGNGFTGDYVLADGREGNLYYGPFPTPDGSSTGPQATVTVNDSANFGIATAATDINDQKATGAPINVPTKSVTDGSGGSSGGSGVTTDAGKVPGGAGRAELGLRMGMWIVVTMFGSSILGALIF